jgi:hypothetical protein
MLFGNYVTLTWALFLGDRCIFTDNEFISVVTIPACLYSVAVADHQAAKSRNSEKFAVHESLLIVWMRVSIIIGTVNLSIFYFDGK